MLGALLIAAQLGVRVWALSGSWFYFDDLAFMSQALNGPMDADYLLQSYGGHLSPAGFALTYLLADVAAYTWWPWALTLLAMQALASFGMLRLLLSLFGRRPLVLALLAGFLFYVFGLSAGIWWAAGVNQLPMLISLVFGLHAFVGHLRTRRLRPLVAALGWTVVGLAFYEKTLLLVGVYAIVAIAYFCQGDTPTRLRQLWRTYRPATLSFALLSAAYLAVYAGLGLQSAEGGSGTSWAHLAWNVVMVSFTTAIIGGPLSWRSVGAGSLADPTAAVQLLGWATLLGAVYYSRRTRTRGLRAWSPVAFTLACNVVLLLGARAVVVGPDIGLEYRYQPESGALFVIGVGLALLPLVGAPERNDMRPGVPLPDRRRRVVAATATVVSAMAILSSVRYVQAWHDDNPTEAYFAAAIGSLERADEPVALVDAAIPQSMLWAYRYPENTYSHVFEPWTARMSFPESAVDDLHLFDESGRLRTMSVAPARRMLPGTGCGYRVGARTRSIPLDGPVFGAGWWVAADYTAAREVDLAVRAGDSTHEVTLPAGAHTLLFSVEGTLRAITMSVVGEPADDGRPPLCVTSLHLGEPQPRTHTERS